MPSFASPITHYLRIDDREAGCLAARTLQAMPDVIVEICRLPVGDYVVDDRVIFERKTLLDFAVSIQDGRLFSQARRLAFLPQRGAVIIEGTVADLAATGMRREALQGALITLAFIFDLPVLRSCDGEESARLMLYTARQMREAATGAVLRHHAGARAKRKEKVQQYLLQGLPGIGPQRAARLLERFGSVSAVIQAPLNELQQVEGVGAQTAKAIRWAVEDAAAGYGESQEKLPDW